MVTHSKDIRQHRTSLRTPHGRTPMGVFGRSPFSPMPLSAALRALAECGIKMSRHRLVYLILALHADVRGDVLARAGDVGHDAGLEPDYARRTLQELQRAGYITKYRLPGSNYSVWHVCALGNGDDPTGPVERSA